MNQLNSESVQTVRMMGVLAYEYCNKALPVQVMRSQAGFYIGTSDEEGPCSRESVEYYPRCELAEQALKDGSWTQKEHP